MSNVQFPNLDTAVTQTSHGTEHLAEPGRRAPHLPPFVDEIAAEVPEVAAELDKLTAALEALEASADKMDDLADEYADDKAEVKAAALAGKVRQPKPDVFWEARRDEIIAAHRALMPPAVNAQFALVEAAAPYVEERKERDRDEIRKAADRLAILIGRSTPYNAHTNVVDGFLPLGSVDNILRALRVIGGAR